MNFIRMLYTRKKDGKEERSTNRRSAKPTVDYESEEEFVDKLEQRFKNLNISAVKQLNNIYTLYAKPFMRSPSSDSKMSFSASLHLDLLLKDKSPTDKRFAENARYGVSFSVYVRSIPSTMENHDKIPFKSVAFLKRELHDRVDISEINTSSRGFKMELGEKIHTLFASWLNDSKNVSSPFYNSLDKEKFEQPGVFQTSDKLISATIAVKEVLDILQTMEMLPLASEYPVIYTNAPVVVMDERTKEYQRRWLYGRCDMIMYDAKRKINILVDYKVSTKSDVIYERYLWELRLEALALYSMGVLIQEMWIIYLVVKDKSTTLYLHKIPFNRIPFILLFKNDQMAVKLAESLRPKKRASIKLKDAVPKTEDSVGMKRDLQHYWDIIDRDLNAIQKEFVK